MSRRKRDFVVGFSEIPIGNFIGRFTLIVGDVNSGKTTLTERILEAYCRVHGVSVSVVDLAPILSPSDFVEEAMRKGVGGRLHVPSFSEVRYFHGRIHAPRLTARDEAEAETLAKANARTIEDLFREALEEETEALFVNDCSLYLHAGNPLQLLEWISSARTAVVNGYEGHSLGEGLISSREREGMAFLMGHCDRLIRL